MFKWISYIYISYLGLFIVAMFLWFGFELYSFFQLDYLYTTNIIII
jgi:hypothetical protein